MHQLITETIYIPYAEAYRTLRIYLPPNYHEDDSFPVIYMHDAQNLFDTNTSSYGAIWDAHTHLDAYYQKTKEGHIIVGIDNHEGANNRLNEYSPWINTSRKDDPRSPDIHSDVGGLGQSYMDFIVSILKPYIDDKFKTKKAREHTTIIGSSMGGLISLYAGLVYPHVFSKIGAFSTAVWFAEDDLIDLINSTDIKLATKWYLDIGCFESSSNENDTFNEVYLNGTLNVHKALAAKVNKHDLLLVVDQNGYHNEVDWSRRFFEAMRFLLPS